MTVNPLALASGIAIPPTPPVPPEIKSVLLACAPMRSNACMIVSAVSGTAAASISVKYAGTLASAVASTATYSAKAPILSSGKRPKTRSPTTNESTSKPTSSTRPTTSFPAVWGNLYGTISLTSPREIILSKGLTPAAVTLSKT